MARMMSTDEQPNLANNHTAYGLSESESLESTQATTKTKQRKKMAADSKTKTREKITEPGTMQLAPSDLQTSEMAEMKSILSELMELKRDARAAEEKRITAEAEIAERKDRYAGTL